ncbi:hypothetical protein FZO89_17720 [Luteimonas viscosa]|uniref:Uncharacterized protein n=1 Tax=Luteimonas viscosa TaxID=1132694 RepID=A0A5D4XET6_9GAMM|nr:hypothetical protein FZO89_17720 [Luteimonas viscosa]
MPRCPGLPDRVQAPTRARRTPTPVHRRQAVRRRSPASAAPGAFATGRARRPRRRARRAPPGSGAHGRGRSR